MKVLILCLMGLTTALAQNPRLETNVSAVRLTFHKQDPQAQGFQVVVGNVSNHTLTEYCTLDDLLPNCLFNSGIGPHQTTILTRPAGFLVAAGLFDNGTYEGDFEIATGMAEHQIAEQVQFQRARRLIDKIFSEHRTYADRQNAELIQKEVTALPEEPEEGMFLLAEKQFSGLRFAESDAGIDAAALHFRQGLADLKQSLLQQLKTWQSSQPPLSNWWKGVQESYEISWGEMARLDMTVPDCDQCPKFKRIPVIRTTTLVAEEPNAPPPAPKPVPVAVVAVPPPEPVATAAFQPPPAPEPVAMERLAFPVSVQPVDTYHAPPPQPLTTEQIYSIFFTMVRNQDLIAAGPNASRRKDYQGVIGLKDREWKILKKIAWDCHDAVMQIARQYQPIAMAYFQKSPRGPYPPPEFKPIAEKERRTIDSYVKLLKLKIGTAAFRKVDAYVQKQFIQDWTDAGGGIRIGAGASVTAQPPVGPPPPWR